MSTVAAKRNDISVEMSGTLQISRAKNWTGATLRWIISHNDRQLSRSGTGVIDSVSADNRSAQVHYTTVALDLGTEGAYKQEWEVTFSDGSVITFPSAGYNILRINEDLG